MIDLNNIIFAGIYFEKNENWYKQIYHYLISKNVKPENIKYLKISESVYNSQLGNKLPNSFSYLEEYNSFLKSDNISRINHMINITNANPNKLIIYQNCNISFKNDLVKFLEKIDNMLLICDVIYLQKKHTKQKISLDLMIYYSREVILKYLYEVKDTIINLKICDEIIVNNLYNKKNLKLDVVFLRQDNIFMDVTTKENAYLDKSLDLVNLQDYEALMKHFESLLRKVIILENKQKKYDKQEAENKMLIDQIKSKTTRLHNESQNKQSMIVKMHRKIDKLKSTMSKYNSTQLSNTLKTPAKNNNIENDTLLNNHSVVNIKSNKASFINYRIKNDIYNKTKYSKVFFKSLRIYHNFKNKIKIDKFRPENSRYFHYCISNYKTINGLCLHFGRFDGKKLLKIKSYLDEDVYGFDFSGKEQEEQLNSTNKDTVVSKEMFSLHDSDLDLKNPEIKLITGYGSKSIQSFLKQISVKNVDVISLLHINCEDTSSTKDVFKNIYHLIKTGTLILFNNLHSQFCRSWLDDFYVFNEYAIKYNWTYEFVALIFDDQQAALIIT